MPPPGNPMPPRERPIPPPFPPRPPGPPLYATEASLAHGDFVIIRSTSSAFHSLDGLDSQNSLELNAQAGMAAEMAGTPRANRIALRLVSIYVRRNPRSSWLRSFHPKAIAQYAQTSRPLARSAL